MTMINRFLRLAMFVSLGVLGLAVRPAGAIEANAAQNLVTSVVNEAMATFAGKTLTPQQRSTELYRMIEKYTDVGIVARGVLGSNWARATDQEKAEFSPLLLNYVARTWQESLSDLSVDQKLTIDSNHPNGKYIVIRSTATAPGEEPTVVDWVLMTTSEGRDIIVDISIDGASILHTLQADFGSFIRNNDGKISALFDVMRKRMAAKP